MIIKYVVLSVFLMVLNINALASSWSFTQKDFQELSESQKEVLKSSYWIGKPHNLGNELAAISIVETRAGAFPDSSVNRICGVHQVDVNIVKENLGSKSNLKTICKALKDNHTLSAIVSLQILLYWKDTSKTLKMALLRYNRGWKYHPSDAEFYRRFSTTLHVLQKNDLSKL